MPSTLMKTGLTTFAGYLPSWLLCSIITKTSFLVNPVIVVVLTKEQFVEWKIS